MLRTIFSILILLISNFTNAQSSRAEVSYLDKYFEVARQQWKVPGMAIAVVKDGQVLLAKGYGDKKLGSNDRVDNKTIFNIGSTTKAMTAFAMGILVDEGKVKWDDRVITHMPEFQLYDAYMTQNMRVRDLFIHTLGLPNADYLWGIATHFSQEEILQRMRYLPPSYPIRGGYTYQNIMYLAAGQLIERLSGLSWEDFIEQNIFTPLGMKDSYPNKERSQVETNRSIPHTYLYGKDEIIDVPDFNADSIAPAGAIWSSIDDMSKWVVCVLDSSKYENGRLLQPETWKGMFEPQAIIPKSQFYPTIKLTQPKWTTYGMGWFQHDYQDWDIDFHTGSLGGTIAMIGLMRDQGIGYYFLGNLDHAEVRHALMYKVFDVLGSGQFDRDWSTEAKELYGSTPQRISESLEKRDHMRQSNTLPKLGLDAYAGTYSHKVWGEVKITHHNKQLYLSIGSLKFPLQHWHHDTFTLTMDQNHQLTSLFFQDVQFHFNPKIEVQSFSLGIPGYTFNKSP